MRVPCATHPHGQRDARDRCRPCEAARAKRIYDERAAALQFVRQMQADTLADTQECEPLTEEQVGSGSETISGVDAGSETREASADSGTNLQQDETIVQTPSAQQHKAQESTAFRAPVIHTSRTRGESYLVVPDTQDPYSAPGWLSFARAVSAEFKVEVNTPGRVLHTGDEADQYWASRFDKDPDHEDSPTSELDRYRERVRETAAVFPHIWHPRSNHGDRWMKRALHAQMPSQLMRAWREVIQSPEGWRWESHYRIQGSKETFLLEHGDSGAQGLNGTRQRVLDNGCSTVHGHQHATAAVVWVCTTGRGSRPQFGFNCACLVDVAARAFDYGRSARFQPTVGIGVILDGGRVPMWIPYGGSWP